MISHRIRYKRIPGNPPGMAAIMNNRRNQMGLIPKNSPRPPQIPNRMRLSDERRKVFRVGSDIIASLLISTQMAELSCNLSADFDRYQCSISSGVDRADQARFAGYLLVELAHQLRVVIILAETSDGAFAKRIVRGDDAAQAYVF